MHRHILLIVVAIVCLLSPVSAADHQGRVVFGGVPVPGATVTATQGDVVRATVTDADGSYHLDLADGDWRIIVEMRGFTAAADSIAVTSGMGPREWALTLQPFEALKVTVAAPVVTTPAQVASAADAGAAGRRRASASKRSPK